MELLLIRHGETEWNKQHRLLGHTDLELDEEGLRESREIAAGLELDFDALYSSPLKRCFQMAELISERSGKRIIVDANLLERDFGSLDGRTWEQLITATGNPDIRAIDHESRYDYRAYGGESAEQVKTRVTAFLDELKRHPYNKVVAVSHVGVIWMMYVLFPQYQRQSASNASIHQFTI